MKAKSPGVSHPRRISACHRLKERSLAWSAVIVCLVSAMAGVAPLVAAPVPDGISAAFDNVQGASVNPGVRSVPPDVLPSISKTSYKDGRIRFKVRDSHNMPVERARVTATFVFSRDAELSRTFELTDKGRGRYSALAELPAKGLWTIHITADRMDRHYESVTTIDVE